MFKQNVSYWDVVIKDNEYEEVEKELNVRFHFSIKAFKLFEENYNLNFFEEYEKAVGEFASVLARNGLDINNVKNLSSEEVFGLIPLVANAKINTFLTKAIPCLYIEIIDKKFVQNQGTFDECALSDWYAELINIEFFLELFKEITKFQTTKKQSKKK